jgi:hypothetical protein
MDFLGYNFEQMSAHFLTRFICETIHDVKYEVLKQLPDEFIFVIYP